MHLSSSWWCYWFFMAGSPRLRGALLEATHQVKLCKQHWTMPAVLVQIVHLCSPQGCVFFLILYKRMLLMRLIVTICVNLWLRDLVTFLGLLLLRKLTRVMDLVFILLLLGMHFSPLFLCFSHIYKLMCIIFLCIRILNMHGSWKIYINTYTSKCEKLWFS